MQPLSASQALVILDNCPFALVVLDVSGQVIGHNRAFEQLLQHLRLCRQDGGATTPLGDDALQALVAAQRTVSWIEQNGEQRHLQISDFAIPEHGNVQVRVFIEITRQVVLQQAHDSANQELAQHTLTDPVTGLLNQRGLMLALEPQVARSRRYDRPVSVIMLSIDHNGSRRSLLTAVARLLKDQLRWADVIGCTEQQAFVLVLPETTADAAAKLVDKLAQQLGELASQTEIDRFCFGISSWRKSDNAGTLLKRAEQSLARSRAERTLHFVAS